MTHLPALLPIRWTPDLLVRVARTLAAPRGEGSAQPQAMRLRGLPGELVPLASALRVLADLLDAAAEVEAGRPLPPAFHEPLPAPGTDAFWQLVWYSSAFRRDEAILDYWEPVLAHMVAALVPDDSARPGRKRLAVYGFDARAWRGLFDAVLGRRRHRTERTERIRRLLLALAPAAPADCGSYVAMLIERAPDRGEALRVALDVGTMPEALELVLPLAGGERPARGPDWLDLYGGSSFVYWYTRDPDPPREWIEVLVAALLPPFTASFAKAGDLLYAALQSPWCPVEPLLPLLDDASPAVRGGVQRGLIERFRCFIEEVPGVWARVVSLTAGHQEFWAALTADWNSYKTTWMKWHQQYPHAPEDLIALDGLFEQAAAPDTLAAWRQWRAGG